jgi:hypothetical protein
MKNFGFTEKAERINGIFAMVSFVVMAVTYLATGQLIPNVW